MPIEILTLANQLVGSAVNGVYQGIIIAAVVALTLRLFGRTNAATRHAIWFCTLLLLVGLLAAHCLIGPVSFSPGASKIAVVTVPNPGLATTLPVEPVAQRMAETAEPGSTIATADLRYRFSGPEAIAVTSDLPPVPFTLSVGSTARGNRIGEVTPGYDRPEETAPVKPPGSGDEQGADVTRGVTRFHWLAEQLVNPISLKLALGSKTARLTTLILLALWLTVAGLRVLALVLQLAGIQKLKRQSFRPGAQLNELFHRLTAHLEVKRNVELRISPTHRSSFLLGFLHPVVLLPAEERLNPAEAELVLRHELAHLRRYDDWANLVQHLTLAVFFFHPAVWWISRQLSMEREIACDDHVLQQSGRPHAYALLLANLAARMQRGLPLLAPGSSNNKTQLKERIDMILNKNRNTSPRLAKTWLAFTSSAVALIAVAVICSAPRIVLAENETALPTADTASADAPPVALPIEIAAVASLPGAPEADSAQAAPRTTPAPAAVGAGPKFKPERPSAPNAPRAVIATAAAPALLPPVPVEVGVIVSPAPFLAAVEPSPGPAPHPPRPLRAPHPENGDSSLEERLERLERMVNSLANQQHPGAHAEFHLKAGKDGKIDRKEIAKIDAFAKRQAELAQKQMLDSKEMATIKEEAERDAERAVEEIKQASADVKQALQFDQQSRAGRKFKEGSQRQLEILRKQVEMLERQKEKLDRQIEHLERDQEALDEQQDEDRADSDTQRDEAREESESPAPTVP
jgi:beta-lactamase regulating signal transducer with metallopeptidase domain